MKEPSKFMPKYFSNSNENRYLLGTLLFIFIAGLAWGLSRSPVVLVIFFVVSIWTLFERKRSEKKFKVLAEERRELSICEFARSFDCREVDTWIIRAVYEQIQDYISDIYTPIAIKADDDLFETLEIDEDDFEEELVEEIAQRTGRSLDEIEKNPYSGKVHTVRDLVYFFNIQPLLNNEKK